MERLTLNLVPAGVMPEAHASQFDNGRVIRFDIRNGEEAYTLTGAETITAEIAKPDGSREVISIPNTSSNYVDLTTEENTCSVPGLYGCEIKITDGAEIIGSQNFILKVEADPYAGENVRTITVGPADICTFETTLPEPLQSVLVNVLATGGNGTPDNPISINGYSSANITRCGVNLFDKTDIADGYIDDTTGAVSGGAYYKHTDYIPVVGGQKIYIMTEQTTARWGAWYDKDKNYISGITNYSQTEATAPNNACFIRLTCKTTDTGNLDTFAVNYPSTPTYHAYNGQTYAIAFGQTVYGGVLDVTRGKLKPCVEYPSYNGETLSGRWLSSEATYIEGNTPPTGSQVVSLDDYGSDIDLTPEVISAIVGTNNVFADCGQTTVKYLKAGG